MTSRVFEKVLVTFCLIGSVSTLLPICFFGFSFAILCLARLLFGIVQIIMISYITAWVDSFSDGKLVKAFQLNTIMIGQVLAYFIGYGAVTLMTPGDEELAPIEGAPIEEPGSLESWGQPWRIAILLQCAFLIPFIMIVISLPNKYFDL